MTERSPKKHRSVKEFLFRPTIVDGRQQLQDIHAEVGKGCLDETRYAERRESQRGSRAFYTYTYLGFRMTEHV